MLKTFVVWAIACVAVIGCVVMMSDGDLQTDLPRFPDGLPNQTIGWNGLAR